MKKITVFLTLLLYPGIFLFADEQSCRAKAFLTAEKTGLAEAILPPGLHVAAAEGLDLSIEGKNGDNIPFELYWFQEKSESVYAVREENAKLLENGRFSWQGKIDKPAEINIIRVLFSAEDFMAKADVYGLVSGKWLLLEKDAAFYKVEGTSRAEMRIKKNIYEAFRIEFISYDQKYKQKPAPLAKVEAISENEGVEYHEAEIVAVPSVVQSAEKIELSVTLPGSGIWIKDINVTTKEVFMGEWILEQETISGGRRQFEKISGGSEDALRDGTGVFKAAVNRKVQGRLLKLTLIPKKNPGNIIKWQAVVRLPRIIFKAEEKAVYSVKSGCGEKAEILSAPSEKNRINVMQAKWGMIIQNKNWKPVNFAEKYSLEGGPFKKDGYAWSALLSIKEPDYYRVVLNQRASMEGNPEGLRIVRQGIQVPYFITRGENAEYAAAADENYDNKTNKSTWEIQLPYISSNWKELVIKSEGIFKRHLVIETQNDISLAWQPWAEEDWSSTGKDSEFKVMLSSMTGSETRIRISIEHGDNKPIKINKIALNYYAPALCFLAIFADGYEIFGGNSKAKMAVYDLSLVQNDLLLQEPASVMMGEITEIQGTAFYGKIFKSFEGTGWGLYAVLGLVTLILLIIIAGLFPKKDENKGTGKRKGNSKK